MDKESSNYLKSLTLDDLNIDNDVRILKHLIMKILKYQNIVLSKFVAYQLNIDLESKIMLKILQKYIIL